jgi:RHS repeat-associated protein
VFTQYVGNCTTVSDEAGKARKSCVDGLGRMTGVWEDPAGLDYETDYLYDALSDLTSVTQKGSSSTNSRNRSFQYDSLSRLANAANPESGTVTYTYDADGNVITKTALSPNQPQSGTKTVVTNYSYDALNRLTARTYADAYSSNAPTPPAGFVYDQPSTWGNPSAQQNNLVGRLSQSYVTTSGLYLAGQIFGYDAMGRIVVNNQCTPVNCGTGNFPVSSTYDLAGNLTSTTNAAGTVLSFGPYDGASRLTKVTSSLSDSQHPSTLYSVSSSVGYYPPGEIRDATFGNGLTETLAYNNRLQPCRVNVNSGGGYYSTCTGTTPSGNVLDFTMGYNAGSADNGNVASWSATGNQTFSRSYTYDSLNRISTMADSASSQACKGLTWTIDAWGNMTGQSQTGTCYTFSSSALANNQLTGYTYDAAGNMTYDGNHHYTYDAENRIVQIDSGSTASYAYNEMGKRIRKSTGSSLTEYYYGPNGSVQAEYNGSSFPVQYVYAGSQLLAEYTNSTTEFVHGDHLGSTRLVTAVNQSIVDNLDYEPFGQTSTDTIISHKFTGKERDTESGLDNFGKRYFGSSMGRFMSPDPPLLDQHIADPQSWNLYSYVRNNPLSFVDPTGNSVELLGDEDQRKKELALLQKSLGNDQAASNLYINKVKDGDKTRYFVGIKGDVGDFMKQGEISHDLANLVQNKNVVEFGITSKDLSGQGGAVTYEKGEVGNQNVRVLVNPDQANVATRILDPDTVVGYSRWGGQNQDPRWKVNPFTGEVMEWHEFGHAWGYINGRPLDHTNPEADAWENRMREQLYGPIGPNNAPRVAH